MTVHCGVEVRLRSDLIELNGTPIRLQACLRNSKSDYVSGQICQNGQIICKSGIWSGGHIRRKRGGWTDYQIISSVSKESYSDTIL